MYPIKEKIEERRCKEGIVCNVLSENKAPNETVPKREIQILNPLSKGNRNRIRIAKDQNQKEI